MATVSFSNEQNINVSHIIMGAFVAMAAAGAFIVLITNMLVGARVSAISESFAQQLAAYQNNPVNVAAAPQTNNAPALSCSDPSASPSSGTLGTSTVLGASSGDGSGGVHHASAWKPTAPKALWGGSYTYNQSNSSVITTTSTNTYTDNRWSGNTNTLTDNRWSGNSLSASLSWNNGNTSNSGNDNSQTSTTNTSTVTNTTNTNNQAWNNGNTTDSNNSPVTTTNTDNSNNSVNTNTNMQAWIWDNGNTENSGNSPVTTTTTTNNTTTNTNNSNNSVNDSFNTTDGGIF